LPGADVSFLYTDEQRQIGDSARRRPASTYSAETHKRLPDDQGRCDESYWQVCQEMGSPAMTIPEDCGGLGLGLIEITIVAEAANWSETGPEGAIPKLASVWSRQKLSELAVDLLGPEVQMRPRRATGSRHG